MYPPQVSTIHMYCNYSICTCTASIQWYHSQQVSITLLVTGIHIFSTQNHPSIETHTQKRAWSRLKVSALFTCEYRYEILQNLHQVETRIISSNWIMAQFWREIWLSPTNFPLKWSIEMNQLTVLLQMCLHRESFQCYVQLSNGRTSIVMVSVFWKNNTHVSVSSKSFISIVMIWIWLYNEFKLKVTLK